MLLSGGASALMAVPADGVTLDDKRATTERLLRAGADIHALNTVRKHLSAIKGGWLAARAGGACDALAISDVVGDDPSVIASGPTVRGRQPRSTTRSTCCAASAASRRIRPRSSRACDAARGGAVPETPKPGDARARAAPDRASSDRGATRWPARSPRPRRAAITSLRLDDAGRRRGADDGGRRTCARCWRAPPALRRPACIVSSGETTVRVTGRGKGGRNQEFALAAADAARAAGGPAVAGQRRHRRHRRSDRRGRRDRRFDDARPRARPRGLAPGRFLADNNAYAFFDALGDLIHTGPTGTNVGDLQVILLA